MKLNFCKILLLSFVQFSLFYCHPKETKAKTTEKRIGVSDSIFNSLAELESLYKAKGYNLLKIKTHKQGKIDITFLIFDNNKIDTLDQGSICKRIMIICKNEKIMLTKSLD